MVFRLAFLIIVAWYLSAASAQAAEPGCLACHPVHYAESGTCVECHRGDPRSTRQVIAHHGLISARFSAFTLEESPVVARGSKRIEASACRRCHVIERRGNRLGTDIDQSVHLSTPSALAEAIRNPALFMPDFHFPEPILTEVINALFAMGANYQPVDEEVPRVVHFEDRDLAEDNPFVKNCGACHRALTDASGGLGSGEVAPNLSGLLTEYFPKTYGEKEEAWTRENLKKWLDNPRKSRPVTPMAPVRLKDEEFRRLFDVLNEDISTSPPAGP